MTQIWRLILLLSACLFLAACMKWEYKSGSPHTVDNLNYIDLSDCEVVCPPPHQANP